MKKHLSYFFAASCVLLLSMQQYPDLEKLRGKWVLESHRIPQNGKEVEYVKNKKDYALTLTAGGKFKFEYLGAKKNVAGSQGSWKVDSSGYIYYFKADLLPPFEKAGSVSDKKSKIIKLSSNQLLIREKLFTQEFGISYYTKKLSKD